MPLSSGPLGDINRDHAAPVLVVPLPGNGPEDVQVVTDSGQVGTSFPLCPERNSRVFALGHKTPLEHVSQY